MKTVRAAQRGSSLIEVLMAGLILAIGMTGIMLLLLRGVEETADSSLTVKAATYTMAKLEQVTSGEVASVDGQAGTTTFRENDAGRLYTQTVTVTVLTDAGVRARLVTVSTSWGSHLYAGAQGTRSQAASTIVSEFISDNPDAGP